MKRYQIQKQVKKYPPKQYETIESFDNKMEAFNRFIELSNSKTGWYMLIDSQDGRMIAGWRANENLPRIGNLCFHCSCRPCSSWSESEARQGSIRLVYDYLIKEKLQ